MKSIQRDERRHEIKVGLTIFVGMAILIAAVLYVGENRGVLQDRYRLHCLMSRVNGLQTGAPVRLAGVRVGSVTRVEFSEEPQDRKIEVVLEIDEKVKPRIRKDSRAHIGTMGLLGDKYVGITMGTTNAPILEEGELLESSDPIDIEKLIEDGADVFGELYKTSQTLTDITDKVNQGQGTLGLLVNDPRLYYDIDRILLLMERLVAKMEDGQSTMAKLFNDPGLYENLNELLETSTALVDSMKSGQGTVPKLLHDPELFNRLSETIENFRSLTVDLRQGKGTLGKALTDEQLYEKLETVASEIDSLVQDIRKNPQRYLKVEVF
jgi:phospholipid/cholesterol/gamma-HCH transport system substrate-binding protein